MGVVVCIRCRKPLVREAAYLLCGCGPSLVSVSVPHGPYHLPINPKDAA